MKKYRVYVTGEFDDVVVVFAEGPEEACSVAESVFQDRYSSAEWSAITGSDAEELSDG